MDLQNVLMAIRGSEGVTSHSKRILTSYREATATMSKDATSKDKGNSETDEPWKKPGEYSQQPGSKGPPRRKAEDAYEGDKAQTT